LEKAKTSPKERDFAFGKKVEFSANYDKLLKHE